MSTPDSNKQNLVYFEASTMRALYSQMQEWQQANNRRLLSISTQRDAGVFCCIALTNPSEVVITSEWGYNHARVNDDGKLTVTNDKFYGTR